MRRQGITRSRQGRSPAGSAPSALASSNALTALEVVDLEERHRIRDSEKRLSARLLLVEDSPKIYAEEELLLTAIGAEAQRAGLQDKPYELAINRMSFKMAAKSPSKFWGTAAFI